MTTFFTADHHFSHDKIIEYCDRGVNGSRFQSAAEMDECLIEVCQDNPAGRREYARRLQVMVQRQNFRCGLCRGRLTLGTATFEHSRRRGMGSAWRDDRVQNERGEWMNAAACWVCNSEKGSKTK